MERSKYLMKNTALFALGNIGTKLISFFLVPLYTNALSTSEYGVVDLVMTICMVLVPILTLNIGESIMRYSLDKDANYDKIMSVGYIIMFFSIVVGFFILPVSHFFTPIKEYGIHIYLYSITFGISQIFICNLRGREKLLQYAICNIIHTLSIALLNIYFLLIVKQGIIGYFWAYIIANLITTVYAVYASRTKFHFSLDGQLMKSMIAFSIVLIPNSFMWWIMNSSDRIMVTAMVGEAANGIYAISYKVPTLVSTISVVFNQAWSYSAIKENKSDDNETYCNIMYDKLTKMLILFTGGLMMIMKPFLSFYVEKSYYVAWRYTPYLLIGFLFMTLGSFLATSYTVHKDSKGFLISGMFGAVVNLILNALLIPYLGVAGAAVATCISYFTVYVFRVWHTRKYLVIHVIQKEHLVGIFLLFILGGTMFVDNNVGQVILIAEYVLMLILFRKFIVDFFCMFTKLIRNKK